MALRITPRITFVICSVDRIKLVNCIRAIKKQNYPQDKIDFLVMKGYMPEGMGGGKQVGCRMAQGEFIAIVDEDNIVHGEEWLNDMIKPLIEDKTLVGSACQLLVDHNDPLINQYIALNGTDPVVAYRSLDGVFRDIKENSDRVIDKGDYYYLKMTKDNLLVTGGNCFIYRKSALDEIGGYVQDTENIVSFAEKGICNIAIPKKARTHHLATTSVREFLRKKRKWGKNPVSVKWKWIEPALFLQVFYNLTVIRNIYIGVRNYFRDGYEPAWCMHPLLALLTTIIYTENYLKGEILKLGWKLK